MNLQSDDTAAGHARVAILNLAHELAVQPEQNLVAPRFKLILVPVALLHILEQLPPVSEPFDQPLALPRDDDAFAPGGHEPTLVLIEPASVTVRCVEVRLLPERVEVRAPR